MAGVKLFWTIFGAVFLAVGAASAVAGTKDLPILKPSYRFATGEIVSWIFKGPGYFRTPEISGYCGFGVTFESSKSKRYIPFGLKIVATDRKLKTTLVPLDDPKKRVSGEFEFYWMPPFYLEIEGRSKWQVFVLSGISTGCIEKMKREALRKIRKRANPDKEDL